MVLYVAICNDSIADRKQLERLFSREKEQRLPDPVIYIDSFGSKEALTDTPVKYDLILLGASGESSNPKTYGENEIVFADHLRLMGVTAPLFLTSSTEKNADTITNSSSLLRLRMPLASDQIRGLIDVALNHHLHKRPLMEIRDEKTTHYIDCADIIYALEEQRLTIVHLADGRKVSLLGTIEAFALMIPEPDYFVFTGKYGVVNLKRVVSKKINAFIMGNKDVVYFNLLQNRELSKKWNYIRSSQ